MSFFPQRLFFIWLVFWELCLKIYYLAFSNISMIISWNSFQHSAISMLFYCFSLGFKVLAHIDSLILLSFRSFLTLRKILLAQSPSCFLLRRWSTVPFPFSELHGIWFISFFWFFWASTYCVGHSLQTMQNSVLIILKTPPTWRYFILQLSPEKPRMHGA